MTDPHDPADAGRPGTPADDAAAVAAELERAGPGRIAAILRGVGTAIRGACALAAATGVAAVLLGAWAWGPTSGAFAIAVLAGLGAAAAGAYVGRRTGQLADAVTHPAEVVAQAKDLVGRATGSPELAQLARRARQRQPLPVGRFARVRRVASSTRLISSVIGLADPDPERHRLLLPFSPVRLRTMWLVALGGAVLWLLSGVVIAAALLTLAVG